MLTKVQQQGDSSAYKKAIEFPVDVAVTASICRHTICHLIDTILEIASFERVCQASPHLLLLFFSTTVRRPQCWSQCPSICFNTQHAM